MLSNPSSGRRTAGRLMVLATVAVALPLTATRAINYIDVPTPSTPVGATAQITAAAPAAPVAAAAPATPAHPAGAVQIGEKDRIMINGQQKHWKELTPAEKDMVRGALEAAKEELERTRIDREEVQREIREAMAEAKIDKEELRRDLAEARAEIDQAMREVDAHAIDIRRSGQDPETIKATIRASLKSVENIDVEAITRNAMNSVDHAAIEASVAAAEAGIAKAQSEIDRLEQRFEQDE